MNHEGIDVLSPYATGTPVKIMHPSVDGVGNLSIHCYNQGIEVDNSASGLSVYKKGKVEYTISTSSQYPIADYLPNAFDGNENTVWSSKRTF